MCANRPITRQTAEDALEMHIELIRKLFKTGELTSEEWAYHAATYRIIVEHGSLQYREKMANEASKRIRAVKSVESYELLA